MPCLVNSNRQNRKIELELGRVFKNFRNVRLKRIDKIRGGWEIAG
jgi:hypothetical protein